MNRDLGCIIKSIRIEKGYSVRELAKLATINHTDVSKLENNKIEKPSIGMLLSLSEVLQSNLLAAYLEDSETYLYYKPLIDSSVGLKKEQIKDIVDYINHIKEDCK